MGLTKTQHFTAQQNRAAQLAKALGHPARIAILELLQNNSCICSELVDELPLSQSTISQHLKALKEAGIIQGDIEGPRTCYCINNEAWQEAQTLFGQFFSAHITPKDCC